MVQSLLDFLLMKVINNAKNAMKIAKDAKNKKIIVWNVIQDLNLQIIKLKFVKINVKQTMSTEIISHMIASVAMRLATNAMVLPLLNAKIVIQIIEKFQKLMNVIIIYNALQAIIKLDKIYMEKHNVKKFYVILLAKNVIPHHQLIVIAALIVICILKLEIIVLDSANTAQIKCT